MAVQLQRIPRPAQYFPQSKVISLIKGYVTRYTYTAISHAAIDMDTRDDYGIHTSIGRLKVYTYYMCCIAGILPNPYRHQALKKVLCTRKGGTATCTPDFNSQRAVR